MDPMEPDIRRGRRGEDKLLLLLFWLLQDDADADIANGEAGTTSSLPPLVAFIIKD